MAYRCNQPFAASKLQNDMRTARQEICLNPTLKELLPVEPYFASHRQTIVLGQNAAHVEQHPGSDVTIPVVFARGNLYEVKTDDFFPAVGQPAQ